MPRKKELKEKKVTENKKENRNKNKSENLGGRPRVFPELDWDKLIRLARRHNTAEDCAYIFGMSVDTLDRRLQEEFGFGYAEFLKKHGAIQNSRLRKAMWNSAIIDKNVPMMIWLSKNHLGMSDKNDMKVESTKPFVFSYELSKTDENELSE